jgi:hypothetical protein
MTTDMSDQDMSNFAQAMMDNSAPLPKGGSSDS